MALEDYPEDLILQHCHFPTSARRDVEDSYYEAVSIFDHGGACADLGTKLGSLEELVQTAWAILLHSYLRGDIISFAVLSSCQNHDYEALVLQYQIFDECRLEDVRPTGSWKSTRQTLKKTQVNTAINLLSSPFRKIGQRNREILQRTEPQDETHVDDVSLVVCCEMRFWTSRG
jgi:hypothetical protein